MCILILLLAASLSSTQAAAEHDISYRFKDAAAVENLFVRVYLGPNATNLSSTEEISFCFLTKTNEITAIYFPKPEYFCRMELRDSNGKVVPQTRQGEEFGRKFTELKNFSLEAVNKRGHNTGGTSRPDMTQPHTNKAEGRILPAPEELFGVNGIGDYKLRLEFQVFKRIDGQTNNTFKVVRLSSIEVPIIKRAK